MSTIIDFLWNNPIWWVPIVGFGGIGTFLAWRFLGWRGALAVLAATGAALFYGKTRRAGYGSRVREEHKDALSNLDRANAARRARQQRRAEDAIQDEATPPPVVGGAPEPAPRPKRVRTKPKDPYDRD
jgi:hypothetical protein